MLQYITRRTASITVSSIWKFLFEKEEAPAGTSDWSLYEEEEEEEEAIYNVLIADFSEK